MSRALKYICGVPEAHCRGSHTSLKKTTNWNSSHKTHGSPEDARRCLRHYYLEVMNFTATEKWSELLTPDGWRYILPKLSSVGFVRKGKSDRFMGDDVHGGGRFPR